ncbi:MAG: hypothetical protein ACI4UE_00855 [Candidatus Scatovivens sp.]
MKKKIIKIIIVFVIIVSFSVYAIAKYYQEITIKSKSEILKPIIQIENDEKIQLNNVTENIIEYKFSIKNYNEKEINKVNMLYRIELINTFNNQNIFFELFDENTNKKIELIENKTEYIKFPIEKGNSKYKLILNLNDEKILNGKINIKIEVKQEKI